MPVEPPANSLQPKSRAAWRKWLEKNHTRGEGVWLIRYKKGAGGKQRFEYADAIEEALCFGWIDGKAKTLDGERAMLWYTERQRGSVWSQPNKERVARLTAEGLMQPAGLEKVRRAREDGSWSALDEIDALVIPPDLAEAMAQAGPAAARHFAAFSKTVKRGLLAWIVSAKTSSTRARRVAESAGRALRNEPLPYLRPATSRQPTS
ncbi:MAG: YdeI/OmpD-associated family protein [Bryobacterales bacterium]|nr:YdeI/OmpD-associated family protein [Bryobacterales bacterium]